MRLLAYLRSLAAKFLRPSQTEADIAEELTTHIQLRADDLARSGMDRAAAERQARIEFGGGARFRDESREALGANFLHVLLQDLRFSLRVLRKSRGFTIVAVVTLAVAICANSVVFGVMNGLILRPLDVPEPASLYGIEHSYEHSMYEGYPDYLDLRDRNRSFESLAGFQISEFGFDAGGNPVHTWAYEITGNYFDTLRIRPYIGRLFGPSDEHGLATAPYAVLGYNFWRNHFQEDRGVIGRTVRINKQPFTIIGVTPPEFYGTLVFGIPDFFVPIVNQETGQREDLMKRANHGTLFMTLGHLKPGVTPQQAAGDLNSIGAYLEKTTPPSTAPPPSSSLAPISTATTWDSRCAPSSAA